MLTNKSPKKQSGVALVMAVMIVAFVSVIAVELSWRFDLSVARNANRWKALQADYLLESAESGARYFLKIDWDQDRDDGLFVDALDEDWAQDIPAQDVGVASLYGRLADAQGKFNVNLLGEVNNWDISQTVRWRNYTENQRRFIRLLQTINVAADPEFPEYIGEYEAEEITQAVMDWMDQEQGFPQLTGSGGAEEDYYLQLEPPLTIPNGPMKSITELRVIRGMTPILYERLLPFVIALPVMTNVQTNASEYAGLNVNTMPYELIRSLNVQDQLTPLDETVAEELHLQTQNGFEDLEQFWQATEVNSLWPSQQIDNNNQNSGGDNASGNNSDNQAGNVNANNVCGNSTNIQLRNFDDCYLVFHSEFFMLSALSEIAEDRYRGMSLIHRDIDTGQTQVIRRTTEQF